MAGNSRKKQLDIIWTLLDIRGEDGYKDLQSRVKQGTSIQVKGLTFAPDLLQDALTSWSRQQDLPIDTGGEGEPSPAMLKRKLRKVRPEVEHVQLPSGSTSSRRNGGTSAADMGEGCPAAFSEGETDCRLDSSLIGAANRLRRSVGGRRSSVGGTSGPPSSANNVAPGTPPNRQCSPPVSSGSFQRLRTFVDASRSRQMEGLGAAAFGTGGACSSTAPALSRGFREPSTARACSNRSPQGEPPRQRRRMSYSGSPALDVPAPRPAQGRRSIGSVAELRREPLSAMGVSVTRRLTSTQQSNQSSPGDEESPISFLRRRWRTSVPCPGTPPFTLPSRVPTTMPSGNRGCGNTSPVCTPSRPVPAEKLDGTPPPNSAPKPPKFSQAARNLGREVDSMPDSCQASKLHSAAGTSVKELKVWLTERNIDIVGCVEIGELQALWNQFLLLREQPLRDLRASCATRGGPILGSADECARFLTSASRFRISKPIEATPSRGESTPATSSANPVEVTPSRGESTPAGSSANSVEAEISRILALQRSTFSSPALWGSTVLRLPPKFESAVVQRSFRGLMKRLHPDKVGQLPSAAQAVEAIREARDTCERSLLQISVPKPPLGLCSVPVSNETGRRQILLTWNSLGDCSTAPVRSYVIAAVDPSYGRAITISKLQPDYSQELHRFVSVEELTSFVLAEAEMQKMPGLWLQSHATVKVAAVNEVGQSEWATLAVPLCGGTATSTASSWFMQSSPAEFQRGQAYPSTDDDDFVAEHSDNDSDATFDSDTVLSSGKRRKSCAGGGRRARRGVGARQLTVSKGRTGRNKTWAFEMELRKHRGKELRTWLLRQKKAPMADWLRSLRYATSGTKEDLVDRIYRLLEKGALDLE